MIGGSLINSFVVCHRKAWLQARNIHTNQFDANIQIGKVYSKLRNTEKRFFNIAIDKLDKDSTLVVTEYKKTFSNIEASSMQLLFYMGSLKKELGIKKISGYIISEETNEKLYLDFTEKEELRLNGVIQNAISIINQEHIPTFTEMPICRFCGHNLYCL